MKKKIPVEVLEKYIANLRKYNPSDKPEVRTKKIEISDTLYSLLERNGGVEHYFL